MKSNIIVQDQKINIKDDYISLTDIAKSKNSDVQKQEDMEALVHIKILCFNLLVGLVQSLNFFSLKSFKDLKMMR